MMPPWAADPDLRTAFRWTFAIVAAVTVARCIVLLLSPLDLYPDEAQYWWWAQSPAFGYFSKPPMIAWIIWATTSIFGGSEWAIRIASPLFHGATALLVFAIARHAANNRLALFSALAYLTLPGIAWSSGLISTDVPLLFFWALAFYAFLRACEDTRWRWPILCGAALGFGLESKYAMLYFPVGAVLAALCASEARRVVFGWRGLAIVILGALLLAPNIVWNTLHGFPTVAHTEANADWGRSHYSLEAAVTFVLGQFGVFGPLLMAGLIGALWRLARGPVRAQIDVVLAVFALPPLLLILVQSFVAGANANWAATAFVSATPLAVCELARWWKGRALAASFALDGAATLVLAVFLAWPGFADALHADNAFKREKGWHELGAQVARAAARDRYDSIAADNRSVVAELLYYTRPRNAPLRVWTRDLNIRDHFEMTMRLKPGARRVLLALEPHSAPRVLATFDSASVVKRLVIGVGGRRVRAIDLYDAQEYRGPSASTLRKSAQSSAYLAKALRAR